MCEPGWFLQQNTIGGEDMHKKGLMDGSLKLQVTYRVVYAINPIY
jgi:hypothetical protein